MYYYLHELQKMDVRIIGLDLKKDVIENCQALAVKYGYDKLSFLVGDIADYEGVDAVDMVVTLHACDTATDYALDKAVKWNAKVIMAVPCCHKEMNKNLKLNNIKNYQIIHGDASVIKDNFDIVIVDPPRSGLSKKVINNLLEINSNKIIYISCNPSTLKRDIDLLSNYELKEVSAFNMFSGTKHVETICILKEGNYDREIIEKTEEYEERNNQDDDAELSKLYAAI